MTDTHPTSAAQASVDRLKAAVEKVGWELPQSVVRTVEGGVVFVFVNDDEKYADVKVTGDGEVLCGLCDWTADGDSEVYSVDLNHIEVTRDRIDALMRGPLGVLRLRIEAKRMEAARDRYEMLLRKLVEAVESGEGMRREAACREARAELGTETC